MELKQAKIDYSEFYSSSKKGNITSFDDRDDGFFIIWMTTTKSLQNHLIPRNGEIEDAMEKRLEGMQYCFTKQEDPEFRETNFYQNDQGHLAILNLKIYFLELRENGKELEFSAKMREQRFWTFQNYDVGSPIYCPIGKNGRYRILGLLTGKDKTKGFFSDCFLQITTSTSLSGHFDFD